MTWSHVYGREGVNKCTHEVRTVGPHSITGRKVTEVHWTGGEGVGLIGYLLIQTYIKLRCVVI